MAWYTEDAYTIFLVKEDSSGKLDAILKYFGSALLLVGIFMTVCFFALRAAYPDLGDRGAFGDQFGVVNTLVSGAGFFGLVMSIFLQSRDLNAQTEALKVQQEAIQQQILEFQEQKQEMRRSAGAQEKVAEVMRLQLQAQVLETAVNLKVAASEAGAQSGNNPWGQFRAQKWGTECSALVALAAELGMPPLHFPKEWAES